MTTSLEQLAERANVAFKTSPGFLRCEPRSTPPVGLAFLFTNGQDAEKFKFARELEPGSGKWSMDPMSPSTVLNERIVPEPPKIPAASVQPNTPNTPASGTAVNLGSKPSEFWTAFLLCLFLGFLGAHRFYARKFKSGAVQLVTLGFCGLWTLVDAVTILLSKFKNSAGVIYKNPSPKAAWGIFAAICILGIISGANDKEIGTGGGSNSHSSQSGSHHQSAESLIKDYAKAEYGSGADVEVEGPMYGGTYQVTVRTRVVGGQYDGGINDATYTATVDTSSQKVTSWELVNHN